MDVTRALSGRAGGRYGVAYDGGACVILHILLPSLIYVPSGIWCGMESFCGASAANGHGSCSALLYFSQPPHKGISHRIDQAIRVFVSVTYKPVDDVLL